MGKFWVFPNFIHGFRGIRDAARGKMMRFLLQSLVACVVLGVVRGWVWGELHLFSWILLWVTLCFMWAIECLNGAVEALCDLVEPNHSAQVRRIKDLFPAAGIFLMFGAVATGIYSLVFNPGWYTPYEAWQIMTSGRLP